MTRFLTSTTIVLALGVSATLAISPSSAKSNMTSEARLANDGAFRDGLYLGKLAAKGGQQSRLAIGRWSTQQDRSQFAAGYRRGYGETLTGAKAERARSAE
jgi:hypothetical protein